MVNLFNATVAIIRLILAFIMLFIGIILLINNPKLNGIVGTIPLSVYIGTLLTIAAFVLGVISIESKPVPGPPGESGKDAECICKNCSNFNMKLDVESLKKSIQDMPDDLIEEHVEFIQKTTLRDQ